MTPQEKIASTKARKMRREEKRAENAELSANNKEKVYYPITPGIEGIAELPPSWPKSTQDAPSQHWGERGYGRCQPTEKKRPRPNKRKNSPTLSKFKKFLWNEISLLVRSWSPVCLACKVNPTEVAAHIVPSNEGAITRYFLPNLYPCCFTCNGLEKWNRATWVFFHRELFGEDYVDALYAMVDEQDKMPIDKRFQLKKWWVLEQTERIKRLRGMN